MNGLTRRPESDMSSVQPENGLLERRMITADSFRALKLKLAGPRPAEFPAALHPSWTCRSLPRPAVLPTPELARGPQASPQLPPESGNPFPIRRRHAEHAAACLRTSLSSLPQRIVGRFRPIGWAMPPEERPVPMPLDKSRRRSGHSAVLPSKSGFCRAPHTGTPAARGCRSRDEGSCSSRYHGDPDRRFAPTGARPCQ